VSEAKGHGFDVRAAEASIAQAKGDLEAAGALPNPTVSLSAGPSIGCYGAGCRAGSPALGAQLSDQGALWQLLAGKRELRERVARSGVEVAQVARLDAERLLTSLVKQQYVGAVIAERTILFSREVRDAARQTSELTRERYRAGAVDEADVSRVETQYLEAEQALDASRQNAEQQRSALRLLLGRPALDFDSVELDARPFLPVHPIESLSGLTVQALVARALEARTDVRAQEAMVTQAEAAVASLQRQRVPDVSLFAGYTQQGLAPDFSSPPNVTFGVSLPVPVVYRLSGEIAHATAAVTAQRAQLDRARAQVRTEVETAWVAYQTALSQLRRMDQGLLRSAARARELVSVQYDKGAASLIEFLDAQRTFIAINVEYLSVLQEYWTAVFHLEAALGQELPS
jgi:cobalt-zinc-cadmium efflux system outer membrane protein